MFMKDGSYALVKLETLLFVYLNKLPLINFKSTSKFEILCGVVNNTNTLTNTDNTIRFLQSVT